MVGVAPPVRPRIAVRRHVMVFMLLYRFLGRKGNGENQKQPGTIWTMHSFNVACRRWLRPVVEYIYTHYMQTEKRQTDRTLPR